jgi:DNA-damage-inducible protein D
MLAAKRISNRSGVQSVLNDPRVRHVEHDGRTLYVAADVVAVLGESEHPAELWADLKESQPAVGDRVTSVGLDDGSEADALDLAGVLRLAQELDSPRAARLRDWMIQSAIERVEEADDPELALLRTRQAYEQDGYSRQWIDQRMRSVSARHELTSEWYRRGVRESEEFRALTNEMTRAAFGFDVEGYRRYKGLFRTGQNLRDHMNDLELSLLALAETTAVELARQRRSHGFDALLLDAKETGQVVAKAREEIEQRTGRAVVSPRNHLPAARQPSPNLAA